jgi:hypothetical protein
VAFTANRGFLWLDDTLQPIASATLYQQVVLAAWAGTTGSETNVTMQITTAPDGFTATGWLYPPYAFPDQAPPPTPTAPQILSFGNTAPIPNIGDEGVYLLIGGKFTSAGSKTFALTFSTDQSSPISDSATLPVAGGGPRTVQVDLYSQGSVVDPTPILLASDLPVRAGGYWTDEDSDAGAAEVTVPELGGFFTDATEGRLLRFSVDGVADRTVLIERVRVVPRSAVPSEELRTLTGRDWLAEFDDALVNPPNGLTARPQVQSVRFDWTHPDCPRPLYGGPGIEWISPYNMGALYKGNTDALGTPIAASSVGKIGQAPRGWPDSFTGWMWERPYAPLPPSGTASHPVMTAWFHLAVEFVPSGSFSRGYNCVADRPLFMVFTADDVGQLAFDGAIVDQGVEPPSIQWQRCSSIVIPDVSAGVHHIAIQATNLPYLQYGGLYNIGSVALCAYQPIRDLTMPSNIMSPSLQNAYDSTGNLVMRTAMSRNGVVSSQITSSDFLLGGGWHCIAGEHIGGDPEAGFAGGFQPPGFTVGMAFRLLFEAAQLQGHLLGWSLGFTDDDDSAGNPWPKTEELTAKVSDTLLAVIRSWHDQGQWDVAARPATRVLDAWVWQQRGDFFTSGAPLVWGDFELTSVSIEGER